MKICTRCKLSKPLSDFHKRTDRAITKSHCKACQLLYTQAWVKANRERDRANKRERKDELRRWFDDIKSAPCTDCNHSFPAVCMDFDHLKNKRADLAVMVGEGYSKAAILAEVAKCELVCSNCHRIRTHKRVRRR